MVPNLFAAESVKDGEESILETLCRTFEGVMLDAKHFRAHWWMPKLRKMTEEGTLIADATNLTSFMDNVEENL
jgi:hypothetical protein